MTAPVPSQNAAHPKSIEDHFASRGDVRRIIEENPFIPRRLSEIVRWLETNMHDAGLKLAIEKLDAPARSADWAKRFGLTPAETRLAAHLLSGGTPANFAAQRRLSPHTVRNHLRSIYGKTNTNRQVSLLQLLLRASGKNP